MSHTPGPWSVNTSGGMTYIENFYQQSICRVATSTADAALIACSPDMLVALEYIVSARYSGEEDAAYDQARSAIAKAKGGN